MLSRVFPLLVAGLACNGDKSEPSDSGGGDDSGGVDTSEWIDDGGPTIYEIQQGVYAQDSIINLEGVIVSSPFTGYGFFLTEPQGGQQAGIWVYTGDVEESEISIEQGDRVAISGVVTEYFSDEKTDSITELILQSAADLEVLGQANLPPIEVLSTAELADPATAELWESCLVAVENVTVTNDYLGYGEWLVDDGVVIDDMFMEGSPINGEILDLVAGPLYYSYGSYKIEPRDSGDLAWTCPADACAEDLVAGDIVITELMDDPAAGPDEDSEWFEIYNASSQSINLKGLVVGDDGDETTTLRTGTVIGIGGYAVFGVGSMESWAYTDFEPDGWYSYGYVGMSNDGDTLHLSNSQGLLDSSATYETETTDEGTAWQLDDDVLDSDGNDDENSWCAATQSIGNSGDQGSPREPNGSCD
jgi:predicted extracellular nuclease